MVPHSHTAMTILRYIVAAPIKGSVPPAVLHKPTLPSSHMDVPFLALQALAWATPALQK